MNELRRILESHDIDASTLRPWREGHRLTVPRGAGLATWLTLRGLVPRTGLWPVLDLDKMRDEEDERLKKVAELAAAGVPVRSVAQFLEAARSIDPAEWLRSRQVELLKRRERWLREVPADWLEGVEIDSDGFRRGEWRDDADRPKELQTVLDYDHWPFPGPLTVLLIPGIEGWHIPAVLRFGGTNDRPLPEVQTAMASYWGHRHDAEVMTVYNATLEMRVGRPPRTRDEAIALAKEHCLFCDDISETVDALASSLLGNPYWHFWWD